MLWRAARILSAGLFAWKDDDVGECWACCEEGREGGGGGGGGSGKEEEDAEEEEDKSTGPMFSKDVVNLESSSSVLVVFIAKTEKTFSEISPLWGTGAKREKGDKAGPRKRGSNLTFE